MHDGYFNHQPTDPSLDEASKRLNEQPLFTDRTDGDDSDGDSTSGMTRLAFICNSSAATVAILVYKDTERAMSIVGNFHNLQQKYNDGERSNPNVIMPRDVKQRFVSLSLTESYTIVMEPADTGDWE